MVRIPRAENADKNFANLLTTTGDVVGILTSAEVSSMMGSDLYVINRDLEEVTGAGGGLIDYSNYHILGMTVDTGNNAIYGAVNNGAGDTALLRFDDGNETVARIIEFAAPHTMPDDFPAGFGAQLQPVFAPDFDTVIMGAESVAFHRQASATDLFFFTDGTSNDFCINWAVQDLTFHRSPSGLNLVTNLPTVDHDFFTDEMRVHANVLASSRQFNSSANSTREVFSDIVLLPIAEQMVFVTGREEDGAIFLVDDLNDNTESNHITANPPDPDVPQLTVFVSGDVQSARIDNGGRYYEHGSDGPVQCFR